MKGRVQKEAVDIKWANEGGQNEKKCELRGAKLFFF